MSQTLRNNSVLAYLDRQQYNEVPAYILWVIKKLRNLHDKLENFLSVLLFAALSQKET